MASRPYVRPVPATAPPVLNVVDGAFVEGMSTFDKISPVDGAVVATVHEAGPELGFKYESAEEVARALVEGLEAGEANVVRGAESRSQVAETSSENPQEMDEQIASMKGDLEQAVQSHRSI